MAISEAGAEEYLYVNLVLSLFFSIYLASLYLLFHARVEGGWAKSGSLRRLITSNEKSVKLRLMSIVIGDNDEVNGALYVIIVTVACIWLYGVAQRMIVASIVIGYVTKHIFFCSALLDINLSYLSDQGWLISKLPVYSQRQSEPQVIPLVPDATRGNVAFTIAGSYLVSAWLVAWLLSGEPLVTGRSAALLNQADDSENIFGTSESGKRVLAHCFELLVFVLMAERLGRILCAIELLRLVFKQRLESLQAAGADAMARADAVLLSNKRIDSLNALLAFSSVSPAWLLVSVLVTDVANITGHSLMQWYGIGSQITAVWCVAISMSLLFLRVAMTAARCGGIRFKIPYFEWKVTLGDRYVAVLAGLCFVSAAARVVATGN